MNQSSSFSSPRARLRGGRTHDLAATIVFALSLATVPGQVGAQVIDLNRWTTDGPVGAMVECGGTIYIGGAFNYVGPRFTGAGVPFDASTGAPLAAFPQVSGTVRAAIPDGAGGWYIGGEFASVGGVPRTGVAHIHADMTVSPWSPSVHNAVGAVSVRALTRAGSTIFVGGVFTSVGELPRKNFAAVDAVMGTPTNFQQDANARVQALAVDGTTLYVGGEFTELGGWVRHRIAAVDVATGAVTAWDPTTIGVFSPHGSVPSIMSLVIGNGHVYAAGNFFEIGSLPRRHIAALDPVTGSAIASFQADANYEVLALALSETRLYVGGRFHDISGQGVSRIAALDALTGAVQPWSPYSNDEVYTLQVHGSTVYAGGAFVQIGGQWRHHFAALDIVTGAATAWAPAANSWVQALALSDGALYAGGRFTSMGGVARGNLAALDAETGMPTPWNPYAKGGVNALAVENGFLYIGGEFHEVAGVNRWSLAAVSCATGEVTPWNPGSSINGFYPGRIRALTVAGSKAYVLGMFDEIGSARRNNMAQLDAVSGYATSWDPQANGSITVLAPKSDVVYAGGNFTHIGGFGRNRIAALDPVTGAALPWDPGADGTVESIVPLDSTIYVAGAFHAIARRTRNGIAALSPTTSSATTWNPRSADVRPVVHRFARKGDTVVLGGSFGTMGGQPRSNLATVDAVTGSATSWTANTDGEIMGLVTDADRVHAAGFFTTVAGMPQPYVTAIFDDLATGTLLSLVSVHARPHDVRLVWQASEPTVTATVFRRVEDGPWSAVERVSADGEGRLEFTDAEALAGMRYGYCLRFTLGETDALLGETWVDVPRAAAFALAGARPNPSTSRLNVVFSLPDASPATLEIIDLAGRRLISRDIGGLGFGTHVLDVSRGERLAPGVYNVRLSRDRESVTKRAVVVQ